MIIKLQHQQLLKALAKLSDDPDTQTACFVHKDGLVMVGGCNQIPGGVKKTPERLQRPLKYTFIEHAERNAIGQAAEEGICLKGGTMFLNWFPCSDCALTIVTSGITTLNAYNPAYEARKDDPRYGFAAAMEILTEGGVTVQFWE